MYKAIFYTHLVSVNLFLLIYLVKTILLVANKNEALAKFNKINKVPEMIISTLFLVSGIYLLTQIGTTKFLIIKIAIVFVSIPVAIIGFKKSNKALAILSLVMIIAAYGLAEMNKKKIDKQTVDTSVSNTEDANYDIKKHGQAIYEANCESCHGKDGSNGPGGVSLTASVMLYENKLERIKNGGVGMHPFKDVLTEKEIEIVAKYVETLKK